MKSGKNYIALALLVLSVLLLSCKKDSGSNGDNNKITTAKFTVNVTGASSASVITFSAAGNNAAGETGIWKVNGQDRTSETAIVLNANNFTGNTKTYVLEITRPVFRIGINLAGDLASNGTAFKINYKAEVNGKVVNDEQNITIDQTHDFFHAYSYDK